MPPQPNRAANPPPLAPARPGAAADARPPFANGPIHATVGAALIILLTWAIILPRAASYEPDAIARAGQNLANLSLAFEEGLSRSLKAADQAIVAVRDLHSRHGLNQEAKDLMAILCESDPMILSIGITAADGDISYMIGRAPEEATVTLPGMVNIADRPHFRAHIGPGPDQLFIGRADIGRVTKRWSVFLTRRIVRPDGSFGGVAIATLDAAKMGDFYEKIDIGPDGVVTVIGTDGFARVRVAADSGARFGDDLRDTPVTRKVLETPVGIVRSTSIVDNQERLLSFRKLPNLPLIVTVAAGTRSILQDVEDRKLSLYITGAMVTLTALLAAAAVHLRWRRDQERRRQDDLLRAVFANMGEAITVVDRDLRLVAWNDRVPDMIGVDAALLKPGTPIRDIILAQAKAGEFGPCDPEAEAGRRIRLYNTSETSTTMRTRPDGRRFEQRRRKLPDGGVLTVFLDITELKNAEQALLRANARLEQIVADRTAALAASERRLSRAQDIARVGHWVRTANTIEYSKAAAAIFGAAPETLAIPDPDYIARFVHPEDRARVAARRHQASAASGEILEYRIVRPDGAVRTVIETIETIDASSQDPAETIGTIHDITERAEAERDLAAARATLLDAVEGVPNGIILYDRDDRVVLFNQQFLDHYPELAGTFGAGMRYEDILRLAIERDLIAIPTGEDKATFIAAAVARHLRANGTPFIRHAKNGRAFEVWENRARNGGIIAVGVEITDRLKVEQQLRQAQRLEAIGGLTGGIAHDFNNLLAIIVINLESLAPLVEHDAQASALIGDSLTAAVSGAGLTQRLLAFARRQTLTPAVVSVNRLIENIAVLMRRVLGETVVISVDLAPDIWPVYIDAAQLEASVLNLATNARDAMPGGGRLSIATGNIRIGGPDNGGQSPSGPGAAAVPGRAPPVPGTSSSGTSSSGTSSSGTSSSGTSSSGTSSSGPPPPGLTSPDLTSPDLTSPDLTSSGLASSGLAPGDYVEITVADTGAGMSADVRARIFEPFFTTKETGRGSGLGLSTVFGFLKQSNGLITVESEAGHGSTFRLYLPRSVVPLQTPPVEPAVPLTGSSDETILVVEDNVLLRQSVVRQLVSLGYKVLEAANADSGLAVLQANTVHLVLSDVLMPGALDGAGFARAVAARWPGIKVILTSGFTDERLNGRTAELPPFARFLAKPVRRHELARAVRETLDA